MIRAVWRFLMALREGPAYGNPGKERPSFRGACLGVNIPSDTLIGERMMAIPVSDIQGVELGCCWGWAKVANIEQRAARRVPDAKGIDGQFTMTSTKARPILWGKSRDGAEDNQKADDRLQRDRIVSKKDDIKEVVLPKRQVDGGLTRDFFGG